MKRKFILLFMIVILMSFMLSGCDLFSCSGCDLFSCNGFTTYIVSPHVSYEDDADNERYKISWNEEVDATKYIIYDNGKELATITDTIYYIKKLGEHKIYVIATNGDINSSKSNEVSFTLKVNRYDLDKPILTYNEAEQMLEWSRISNATYYLYDNDNKLSELSENSCEMGQNFGAHNIYVIAFYEKDFVRHYSPKSNSVSFSV